MPLLRKRKGVFVDTEQADEEWGCRVRNTVGAPPDYLLGIKVSGFSKFDLIRILQRYHEPYMDSDLKVDLLVRVKRLEDRGSIDRRSRLIITKHTALDINKYRVQELDGDGEFLPTSYPDGDFPEMLSVGQSSGPGPRKRRKDIRRCVKCQDVMHRDHFPEAPISTECSHAASWCTHCVMKKISMRIRDGHILDLKCPECNGRLVPTELKQLVTVAVYEQYETTKNANLNSGIYDREQEITPPVTPPETSEGADG